MDAIKFLKMEHNKVRKVLAAIKRASREITKKKKFIKLAMDLTHHEKMEQKVWYPYLKKNTNVAPIIKHLASEEKKAAKKISKIKKVKSEDAWDVNFLEFKKSVEHHAGEEEKKLFPKVNKQLTKIELQQIGKKMRKYKKALDRK